MNTRTDNAGADFHDNSEPDPNELNCGGCRLQLTICPSFPLY